jgi:hypothetical protein
MEPVTAIVSAIVPLIANKALEKGGEKIGLIVCKMRSKMSYDFCHNRLGSCYK